jgi:hypothetical protein
MIRTEMGKLQQEKAEKRRRRERIRPKNKTGMKKCLLKKVHL